VNEREQIPLPVDLPVTAQALTHQFGLLGPLSGRQATFFTLPLEAVTPALFAHNQLRELDDERRETARAASLESR